jgi:hypothetical protein
MKKLILSTFFLALACWAVAQKGGKQEKIKEARVEFMKKKLALTPEEEKKFVPLYEKMIDEMQKLRQDYKQEGDMSNIDLTFMDDKECEKAINDFIQFREKELQLIKNYNQEFQKILPIKKVAMIYKAETEFKKKVLRELRNNRKKAPKED